MKRDVKSIAGKTVNMDCDVYLNGEIQYGEDEYQCVLWVVEEDDIRVLNWECLKDMKILVVREKLFEHELALKELGYG